MDSAIRVVLVLNNENKNAFDIHCKLLNKNLISQKCYKMNIFVFLNDKYIYNWSLHRLDISYKNILYTNNLL